MKYKFIDDLTSDVMFEAYGKTLEEVFTNAAEALFSVICQTDKIECKAEKEIEVKASGLEELMINWLQELITLVDIDEVFFKEFKITEIDEKHLKAVCCGEEADPAKGETVVKAVTYYKYKFEKTKDGYVARVSLDI